MKAEPEKRDKKTKLPPPLPQAPSPLCGAARKHREQIFQLVLTGTAVFLLLFCLTGVSAYATVSSALQQTGGSTPLPESYAIAPIAAPASDALQAASSSLEISEEDYQNRLLIPTGFAGNENEASVPEPPPQDEDGRYILADSALPETYTVTVETGGGGIRLQNLYQNRGDRL